MRDLHRVRWRDRFYDFGRSVKGAITPQQWRVLALVHEGKTNAEIAEKWGLSIKSVEGHVMGICRKLNVRNRVQAAVWFERVIVSSRQRAQA